MCVDIVDTICVDIVYVYVPSDLLGELAGVGRVELDPEVEGDGGDALDLLRHALPGLQPVLNTKIFVNRQKIFIRNMHKSFAKDKPEDKENNRSKSMTLWISSVIWSFVMIYLLRLKAKCLLKTTPR